MAWEESSNPVRGPQDVLQNNILHGIIAIYYAKLSIFRDTLGANYSFKNCKTKT